MEDKHIMDVSIVASLQERDVFNDITKWNKIFVKWGSIYYQQQQFLNISSDEVRRTEDQTLSFFLSFGYPRSMSYISSTQSKEA
jgi:RNA recognition motif-containing protein